MSYEVGGVDGGGSILDSQLLRVQNDLSRLSVECRDSVEAERRQEALYRFSSFFILFAGGSLLRASGNVCTISRLLSLSLIKCNTQMQLLNDATEGNLDLSEVIDFVGLVIRNLSGDTFRFRNFVAVSDPTECAFDDTGSFNIASVISELASTCPERTSEFTGYRRRVLNDEINGQLSCILGSSSVKDANLREMARLAIKLTEKIASRDREEASSKFI